MKGLTAVGLVREMERWARYSFLAIGHRLHGRASWEDGDLRFTWTAPEGFTVPQGLPTDGLASLRAVGRALRGQPQPDLPRFWGGLVGVCGHDFVRAVESLPPPEHHPPQAVPGIEMIATDVLVIFDNLTQRVKVVGSLCPATDGGFEVGYARAVARVREVADALLSEGSAAPTLRLREPEPSAWETEPTAPWSRDKHIEAVAKKARIPLQHETVSATSGTDTDVIFWTRGGIASALISLPNRYMHSPIEVVSLKDLEQIPRLMAGFAESVKKGEEFKVKI